MVQWTRKRMLRIFNLYAYDVSYEEREVLTGHLYTQAQHTITQLGRAPWLVGAGFNQEPNGQLPAWRRPAYTCAPPAPRTPMGRLWIGFL